MKTIVFWVGAVACVLAGAALEGVHLNVFVQPSAAVSVFGPVFFYLLYACGVGGLPQFSRRLVTGQFSDNDQAIANNAGALGALAGGATFILGLVHVMMNMADSSRIGAGVAVALIGLLYGIVPTLMSLAVSRSTRTAQVHQFKSRSITYAAACFAGGTIAFVSVMHALAR